MHVFNAVETVAVVVLVTVVIIIIIIRIIINIIFDNIAFGPIQTNKIKNRSSSVESIMELKELKLALCIESIKKAQNRLYIQKKKKKHGLHTVITATATLSKLSAFFH